MNAPDPDAAALEREPVLSVHGTMVRLCRLIGAPNLFENDGYRHYWFAQQLSSIPSNAIVYTMLILAVGQTGRSFYGSLFAATYILPAVLVATVSGALVDRLPKGAVMVATSIVSAVLCVVLAISTDRLAVVYLVALAFAITAQLAGAARSAAVPLIVGREELADANSLSNLGGLISQAVGLIVLPLVFLKTVGAAPLAFVCAALFAASLREVLLIPHLGGRVGNLSAAVAGSNERFYEAWRELRRRRAVYLGMVLFVLTNAISLVVVTLVPRYATTVLNVDAQYGVYVVSPSVIGIWLGLRVVRSAFRAAREWWAISLSYAGLIAGVIAVGFVRTIADALVGWGFLGPIGGHTTIETARIFVTMLLSVELASTYTFIAVAEKAMINERIPHEMQGSVFVAQNVLAGVASIPPILLTGLLADVVGVTPVFIAVGTAAALIAVIAAATHQTIPDAGSSATPAPARPSRSALDRR